MRQSDSKKKKNEIDHLKKWSLLAGNIMNRLLVRISGELAVIVLVFDNMEA